MGEPHRTENNWEDAVFAALKAYRSIPHTSTGETPAYLAFGRDPILDIDKTLPILRRSHAEPTFVDETLNQLKVACGIARKNLCLARQRNKNPKGSKSRSDIKVGDLVVIKSNTATKAQSSWKMGYRVIKLESDRTVQVQDIVTGKKYRVGVQHVKRVEPLSMLLDNSHIDMFPEKSKLYLPAHEINDLKWPPPTSTQPLGDLSLSKLVEATRDRSKDKGEQHPVDVDGKPVTDNNTARKTRSGRVTKPRRETDFIYVSAPLVPSCRRKNCKIFAITWQGVHLPSM